MQKSNSAAEAMGVLIGGALFITAIVWWKHDSNVAPPERDVQAEQQASALRIFETDLQRQGKALVQGTEAGVLQYEWTKQTLRTPIISYLVRYSSSDSALMALEGADKDPTLFAANTAKRLVWEQKFCTDALKQSMQAAEVNLVIGEIADPDGKMQFAATCTRE